MMNALLKEGEYFCCPELDSGVPSIESIHISLRYLNKIFSSSFSDLCCHDHLMQLQSLQKKITASDGLVDRIPYLATFFSHLEVQRQTSLSVGIDFPFDVDCVKIPVLDRSFKIDIHHFLFIPRIRFMQLLHRGDLGVRVTVIGGTTVTFN